ncbi:MAG: phosphoglycerate dehydrogenase [Candidatus Pedobacter colombiensis]|uniref:Phosphoglycerate dehydrogenase n=1 Tax=Candidatus Pedobacter colombiensis TaxID=3121371 RepID=A0AAJ5W6X3_9SPHI|nr:phosphoglycerate dehydrogenase [Pedobacter sp.]WEK19658.1 MAG: phosphoglycerate dehydrogenase [Pedobacter sp.]
MKVKVSNVAFSKNQFLVEKLKTFFPDAVINIEGKRYLDRELIDYFSDADAAIVGLELITPEVLDQLPNLRAIAKYGVGLDNIDIPACEERGVKIGWTGGVNKDSVAEMVVGFMLALSRNLYVTSNQLKSGTWNKNGGSQLVGKTIGIIGVGHIGKTLINLLKPFKCRVLINDILDISDYALENNLDVVDKEYLFKEADIISVHTPLNNDTRNLFDAEVFEMMKKTAFLINTARGGIVNENDLKHALSNGIIAGAALDVFEIEPPNDRELLQLENLICTPHTGGNSYEAVVAMGLSAIDHLLNYRNKLLNNE